METSEDRKEVYVIAKKTGKTGHRYIKPTIVARSTHILENACRWSTVEYAEKSKTALKLSNNWFIMPVWLYSRPARVITKE